MTKHRFTDAERYAVYTAQGDVCYMCRTPLDMATFQVDHVVPEELADDPDRVAAVLRLLGRPTNFNINGFENWLPACGPCNNTKRARVWDPSPLVQLHLQRAAERADRARQHAQGTVTKRQVGNALMILRRLRTDTAVSDEVKAELQPLVDDYIAFMAADSDHGTVRVTPTYSVPLYTTVSDNGMIEIVDGPYGRGGGPSARDHPVSSGMKCGVCGYPYFNGTRCVVCGTMNDGD